MGGSIWWDVEGEAPNRRYVVAWEEVPHYNDIGSAYFEVIFDEATDAITFQYQDVAFEDPLLDYGRVGDDRRRAPGRHRRPDVLQQPGLAT